LVDSRKGIIESKQKDGKMISKKNKEWENIGKELSDVLASQQQLT
jgi:hypothetical protein